LGLEANSTDAVNVMQEELEKVRKRQAEREEEKARREEELVSMG